MEEQPLDLKAVIEQLQHENEELRLSLAKMYWQHSFSWAKCEQFLRQHYLSLVVLCLYMLLGFSFIDIFIIRRYE